MRAGEHKIARDYVIYREQQAAKRAARQALSEETQQVGGPHQRHPARRQHRAPGPRAPARHRQRGLRRPRGRLRVAHPRRGPAQPLRRRERRSRAGHLAGHHRAHADRAGAQLHLRLGPPAAATTCAPRRCPSSASRTAPPRRTWRRSTPRPAAYIRRGVELELLDKRLAEFDLERLGAALKPERDLQFTYLGPADPLRPLLHPQQRSALRAAAGLLHARRHGPGDQRDRPREARHRVLRLLSSFDYMSSTPTLFNAGTLRPQLSPAT
jgi:ribonucleoside-diphosphate reductase alpha chain